MKQQIKSEEIFYNDIYNLIEKFFIKDINYINGYYLNSNKSKANYILERMKSEKHLIDL
jgi:hypothetical protein